VAGVGAVRLIRKIHRIQLNFVGCGAKRRRLIRIRRAKRIIVGREKRGARFTKTYRQITSRSATAIDQNPRADKKRQSATRM